VDVTSTFNTGTLGGMLRARDTTIPGYLNTLDTLAATVVAQVNSVHSTGYDLNGAAAGNFFAPISGVAGASTAVTLSAAVAADPAKIAAAGSPNAGDNTVARALSNLRDARVIGGVSTMAEGWGALVYQVGKDVSSAESSQKTHADIVGQLQTLRDAASGVSIDEEGASMLKFQRAYQANAKYFQTVNDTISTLLALVP
jgi:flagellar hook-associated protein 1 FlgK